MTITKPVLYYDAKCKLCNTWLNILRIIDKNNRISYSVLQAETGKILFEKYKFDYQNTDTVVFKKDSKIFLRSEAVIECISYINGLWSIIKILRIIPLNIRDSAYNIIAKNRYKWFGKTNSCEI